MDEGRSKHLICIQNDIVLGRNIGRNRFLLELSNNEVILKAAPLNIRNRIIFVASIREYVYANRKLYVQN